jgi:hypothetical protein
MLLLQPVVLVLQLVDLLPELVDGLVKRLELSVLLVRLFCEVGEGGFEFSVEVVGIGFELGDVDAQVFGFCFSFCQDLEEKN